MKDNSPQWKRRMHEIIFEADTPKGKVFDVSLIIVITISVAVVLLDSVASLNLRYGNFFTIIEWVVTLLFTAEYILRILSSGKPSRYIFSFFGMIDLLATLPTYISLFMAGSQYLLVVRILRLLRIFRILKLGRFIKASRVLTQSLRASRYKIMVFVGAVLLMVTIAGSMMYLIEGPENGYTSIPRSIYWAIVTLTTVGYGDIAPQTVTGQALASFIMIMGYGIIAVPTGIITVELSKAQKPRLNTQVCGSCGADEHDDDARYCKKCGFPL